MSSVKEETIRGVKWSAIDKFSLQIIQFGISIVLARLLTPTDYGVIGVLGVFMAVSGTFIDSGFGTSLIRKQDRTDLDCTTVFYFNLAISILCYIVLFFCSPLIASFFKMPILTEIVKVYCFSLIIGALGSVQFTRLTIAIDFKTQAIINLSAAIISGTVGIVLAYNEYGAWSLVYQSLINELIRVVLVWIFSNWHPTMSFSKESFNNMFAFGSRITAANLLHTIYSNLSSIIIGRSFSAADLGFYSKGTSTATLPAGTINTILGRVTYPILAKIQDDDDRLVSVYRKYIKATSMVIIFLMTLVAALGKPIIIFLFTEKWSQAIIYLQLFSFAIMFDHICQLNLNLLYVKGRSDYILRLEIIKKTISTIILFASIPFGVIGICASKIIYTQIAVFINTWYTGRLYKLGYFKQLGDFMPYLALSVIACVPSLLLAYTSLPSIIVIILGAALTSFIYIGMLIVIKDSALKEIVLPMVKERYQKIFKK